MTDWVSSFGGFLGGWKRQERLVRGSLVQFDAHSPGERDQSIYCFPRPQGDTPFVGCVCLC